MAWKISTLINFCFWWARRDRARESRLQRKSEANLLLVGTLRGFQEENSNASVHRVIAPSWLEARDVW